MNPLESGPASERNDTNPCVAAMPVQGEPMHAWRQQGDRVKLSQLGLRHAGDRRKEDGVFEADPFEATSRDSSVVAVARRTVNDVAESDVPGLAAEMAYHSLFGSLRASSPPRRSNGHRRQYLRHPKDA